MFKFRPLTAADFPLMLAWLSKPHVKRWWDDGEDTLEKIARHYGEDDKEAVRFILLETTGDTEKPIGYFQYYQADEGVIGIDQFIGDESRVNKGVGTEAVKKFVRLIIEQHAPREIVLDPSPDNKRAIRCYEKVGFRHYETRENDDGQPAYMMRLESVRPTE